MNDFEIRVLNAIKNNNLIKDGDKVVVGFSGGPDSTTLLHILNKISICFSRYFIKEFISNNSAHIF